MTVSPVSLAIIGSQASNALPVLLTVSIVHHQLQALARSAAPVIIFPVQALGASNVPVLAQAAPQVLQMIVLHAPQVII